MAELKGTLKVSNFLKGKLLPFGVSPGAVLYNMSQNLSEEEKARARANIGVSEGGGGGSGEGNDESQVFYAEYGVTTMDEIRAAFDAGKAVFAFRGIDGAGMIGQLVNISGEAVFVCHDGDNNMFFYCGRVGWAEGYFEQDTTPVEISSIDVEDGTEAVTFTTTFSDGSSKVRVITKDAEGNPAGMTDDGKAVTVTWTEVD